QAGIIRVFENTSSASTSTIFLDIRDRLTGGGELGLLGLAFHPSYATNGYFYVNYTAPNPLRTIIARYSVSTTDPNQANKGSEQILLAYNQPYTNHNGGQVSFGSDGYLYIASGDGGSGGDPQINAQNRSSLLGKILRIDVNNPSGGRNYGIPADNPFAGNSSGFREEIFAYGLRNPWRFSFDAGTGTLWCGDVGQGAREEIDIIENGKNYGWRTMEGSLCFNPSTGCTTAGLTLPVWEYGRAEGYSVTGGFVYRGTRNPELTGAYIYGDYGSGRIWALRSNGVDPPSNSLIAQISSNRLSSFGADRNNELYICSFDGKIYRFAATPTGIQNEEAIPLTMELFQNHPNPFNPRTSLKFSLPTSTFVALRIFDALGRHVGTPLNEVRMAGEHSVAFDASDLPAGMYVCRLEAVGQFLVQKMLLVK
ncbi:MAG: PQQ-dependent sugar dehydrogenase, partial [Bacteroidota bacterium]